MTNTTLRGWMNSMSVKTIVRTFKTMKNHTSSILTPVNYNSDTEFFPARKRHGVRQGMENHSGVDGDIASHKSTAICWRYKKKLKA